MITQAKLILFGAVAAGFLLAVGGSYFYGRSTMDAEWRAKTLQRSVEMLRGRRDTNAYVKNLSDADLCRALGGVPNDAGECL